jgi:hypothetical protein
MLFIRTLALFIVTAIAEIVGCYLPYVWLRKSGSAWLLAPALLSLVLFVWLLTLHPTASGRVYDTSTHTTSASTTSEMKPGSSELSVCSISRVAMGACLGSSLERSEVARGCDDEEAVSPSRRRRSFNRPFTIGLGVVADF